MTFAPIGLWGGSFNCPTLPLNSELPEGRAGPGPPPPVPIPVRLQEATVTYKILSISSPICQDRPGALSPFQRCPGGNVVKSPPANAGDVRDTGLVPRLGRSPGGGLGNPIQYSCPETPMDRGAWRDTVHRVSKSQARLKGLSTQRCQGRISRSTGHTA